VHSVPLEWCSPWYLCDCDAYVCCVAGCRTYSALSAVGVMQSVISLWLRCVCPLRGRLSYIQCTQCCWSDAVSGSCVLASLSLHCTCMQVVTYLFLQAPADVHAVTCDENWTDCSSVIVWHSASYLLSQDTLWQLIQPSTSDFPLFVYH